MPPEDAPKRARRRLGKLQPIFSPKEDLAMSEQRNVRCPECGEWTDRREFMKGVSAAAMAASAGVLPMLGATQKCVAHSLLSGVSAAEEKAKTTPETAVKRLYDSLSDKQKSVICKPFDDPLRQKYSAN